MNIGATYKKKVNHERHNAILAQQMEPSRRPQQSNRYEPLSVHRISRHSLMLCSTFIRAQNALYSSHAIF